MGFIAMKTTIWGNTSYFFHPPKADVKKCWKLPILKNGSIFVFGISPKVFRTKKATLPLTLNKKNCWRVVVVLLNLKIGSLIPKNKKRLELFLFPTGSRGPCSVDFPMYAHHAVTTVLWVTYSYKDNDMVTPLSQQTTCQEAVGSVRYVLLAWGRRKSGMYILPSFKRRPNECRI